MINDYRRHAVAAVAEDGGAAIGSSPAEFARHMADETARWQNLARLTGLKLD